MKSTKMCILVMLLTPALAFAGKKDDPVLAKVMVDQLEVRAGDGSDSWVLDAQGWIGRDLDKLWVKVDVESVESETEAAEVQALYSRAIAPYWDLQAGWRHDLRPEPSRDWLAIGFEGLAPYWFEVDAAAFIGEDGRTAARLQAEYELLFTQKLILAPEAEFYLNGKDDPEVGIGTGLSSVELGMRLRYELRRELAPYIGINWEKLFGQTANHARDDGHDASEVRYVVGLRAWF